MRLVLSLVVAVAGLARAQTPVEPAQVSAQAVNQLRNGQSTQVWSLMRQAGDNTVRSFVVRDLARLGVSPDLIVDRLRTEADVSARRALLLSLGEFGTDRYGAAMARSAARGTVSSLPTNRRDNVGFRIARTIR